MSRVRCVGAVLAGGAASRYGGRPKGLEMVGGVRIVDRVAAALRPVTDRLFVIADTPAADAWVAGAARVPDVRPGRGALGGIHAALAHAAGDAVLVVAWDMPGVTEALLRAIRALGDDGRFDAVVPAGRDDGDFEPLCAWYAPSCREAIERRLGTGDLRASAWLADVRVRVLSRDEQRAFGDPARLFANVNAPEDLAAIERARASGEPPARG